MADPAVWRGILWVTGGTATASVIYASAKLADGSAGVWQIMFVRYLGALLLLALLARLGRRNLASLRSRHAPGLFARTLCGVLAAAATTYAAAHMPIADATAIGMLDGLVTVALGILFLREFVGLRHVPAMLLCVGGAFFVVAGRGAGATLDAAWLLPAAVALLGALIGAIEAVLIRILALREDGLTMMVHTNCFALAIVAVPAFLTWRTVELGPNLFFLALGPVAILCQYCNIRGYRIAPMSVVGPVGYSWIVFAALIGFLAFGELPTWATVAGSMAIVAGGVWMARVPVGHRPLRPVPQSRGNGR